MKDFAGVFIDSQTNCFVKEGQPFFYFADTAWSSFTHATMEDWREYIRVRRSQGFNTIQINLLPQHDASVKDFIHPFARTPEGTYIVEQPDKRYFDRVVEQIRIIREEGLIPSLVLLWCNYVPGNWLSDMRPNDVLPRESIPKYIQMAVTLCKPFRPVYMVSGDTNLDTPECVDYYSLAIDTAREHDPQALLTLHICGTYTRIPDELGNKIDFIMYQSGHGKDDSEKGYEMAEELLKWKKPLLNGEPNYEGIRKFGSTKRVSREEVRRVSWQSVTAGAKAGITYGAHGIWPWHEAGNSLTDFYLSNTPFYWNDCMHFPGASDVAWLRKMWYEFRLYEMEPAQELVRHETADLRCMATLKRDRILIYAPYATLIYLTMNASEYEISGIMLHDRGSFVPEVTLSSDKGATLGLPRENGDYLILLEKH